MSWLNASLLPDNVRLDRREGLFAECYPDGQLRHLGFYSEGSCDGTWALYLEHGVAQGKAMSVLRELIQAGPRAEVRCEGGTLLVAVVLIDGQVRTLSATELRSALERAL